MSFHHALKWYFFLITKTLHASFKKAATDACTWHSNNGIYNTYSTIFQPFVAVNLRPLAFSSDFWAISRINFRWFCDTILLLILFFFFFFWESILLILILKCWTFIYHIISYHITSYQTLFQYHTLKQIGIKNNMILRTWLKGHKGMRKSCL